MGGHVDCVRLMLDAGVGVNDLDLCGKTALICASQYGHVDCVRLLLEKGADKDIQNQVNTGDVDWC